MKPFLQRLTEKDTTLFSHIESQSTDNDKRSLLSIHAAVRDTWDRFHYMEIGSHLGGSLQVLVADEACHHITSIDPRPKAFADERGIVSRYPENSTARMLSLLEAVPGSDTKKIETVEKSTADIPLGEGDRRFHFCFIDGEHTNTAVSRDSKFCLERLEPGGCIAYHDANVVFEAIGSFIEYVESTKVPYQAFLLPDAVFVIEFGDGRLCRHPAIAQEIGRSWRGYVAGLSSNVWYRAVMNKPFFKLLRRIPVVRRIFIVKDLKAQPI